MKAKKMGPHITQQDGTILRTAWEDPETIRFILKNFSYPERNPLIISKKWLSNEGIWNVVLIENPRIFRSKNDSLINVAWIEINPITGKILRRHYFSHIFFHEYKRIIGGSRATRIPLL